MVFSSLTFIFVFFPLVISLYFLKKDTMYKNFILFIFSIFFYSWGEPIFVIIMFLSIINDYVHALLIDGFKRKDQLYIAKLFLYSCPLQKLHPEHNITTLWNIQLLAG